jgi:Helicase C-terminal domain
VRSHKLCLQLFFFIPAAGAARFHRCLMGILGTKCRSFTRITLYLGFSTPASLSPPLLLFRYHALSLHLLSYFCFLILHHQAFRAANQAIGRCIRHKADYGRYCRLSLILSALFQQLKLFSSVLFVDSRFGADDRPVPILDDSCSLLRPASHACHQLAISSQVDPRPNEQVQRKRCTALECSLCFPF